MSLDLENKHIENKNNLTLLKWKLGGLVEKIYLAISPREKSREEVMQDILKFTEELDRDNIDNESLEEIGFGMKKTAERYIRYIETNNWEGGRIESTSVGIRHLIRRFDANIGHLTYLSKDDQEKEEETKRFLNNIHKDITENKLRIV